MSAIVTLEKVTKRFGKVAAVRDVSFALNPGSTVALVGHNGAGKSTLMKMMLGLARPTAGIVRVLGGEPARGSFAERSRLGYLPENVAFHAALTGREALTFYARLKGQPLSAVDPLLARVGIAHAAGRRVGGYSKGMRQRLGLAQALLGDPQLLLLDEPTTGLDPELRLNFYDILDDLRGRGVCILLASHALTELENRADRVIIMNRGVKVADGSLDELRRIAHLPTRIRVATAAIEAQTALAEIAPGRAINGHAVEFITQPQDSVALVQRIATTNGVTDIEIAPPNLDDLYAHFLRSQPVQP